jgi:hypothetical protein
MKLPTDHKLETEKGHTEMLCPFVHSQTVYILVIVPTYYEW